MRPLERLVIRRLAIDLSPVPNLVDRDMAGIIINLIYHPIVPLPDAIPIIVTRQFLRAVRTRIHCQRSDLGDDARSIYFRADCLKLLAG